MKLLLFVLSITVASGAKTGYIDWTRCNEDSCLYPCSDVNGQMGTTYLESPKNTDITDCAVGLSIHSFSDDIELFQLQVGKIGEMPIAHDNPIRIEILFGKEVLFGCEKKEDGSVKLVAHKSMESKHKIELFERRSVFEPEHALCAIKLQYKQIFQKTLQQLLKESFANSKPTMRYVTAKGEEAIFEYTSKKGGEFGMPFFLSTNIQCDPFLFKDVKHYYDMTVHIKPIMDLDRKVLNCENYGPLKHILRMGNDELESLTCHTDGVNSWYEYSSKGSGSSTKIEYPEEMAVFCVLPIDRTCVDPFTHENKPNFTRGTDDAAATLKCPQDKWLIDNKYPTLNATNQPVCKFGEFSNKNEAEFYVTLDNGDEVRLMTGKDAVNASCFTQYDCDIVTELDYNECKKEDGDCEEVEHGNGILKCKDDKASLRVRHYSFHGSLNATQYTCDGSNGQWKDTNGTALETGWQVACERERNPEKGEVALTDVQLGLIIGGSAIAAVLIAALVGFFFYRYCTRRSLRDIEKVTKKKWKTMKKGERLKYAQFVFGTVTDPKPGSLVQIVHGLDALELMLSTETEDPEVWEEVMMFLTRLQGALAALDFSVHHQYTRYLYLQAKQIIDRHGWTSPTRITKSSPRGLIRSVAVQLLSRCYGDRYYEDSEMLIAEGFHELGMQGVEQYPHCGLLWTLMTQVRQQKYSTNVGPNLPEHSFNFFEFCNKLYDFVTKPELDIPKGDVIPQFESVCMQASFALGASNNYADLVDDVFEFFQKKENDDGTRTANYLLGMGYSMCTNPGPKIFISTRALGDLKKALLELGPESLWEPNIDVIVRLMVDFYRSLDAKRLQNKVMPEASEEFIINLKSSQHLFEGAARKQMEDLRDWFSHRIDLEELKKKPEMLSDSAPETSLKKRKKKGSKSVKPDSKPKASSKESESSGSGEHLNPAPGAPAPAAPAEAPIPPPTAAAETTPLL